MRKSFSCIGGALVLSALFMADAAPLAPQSPAQMLGLRQVPAEQFSSAPALTAPALSVTVSNQSTTASSGPAFARAPRSARAEGEAPLIYASVIYPDNVTGVWTYPADEYNPSLKQRGILATGGGMQAKGLYYVNRYLEAMGYEEIKTFSYKLSDWSIDDEYSGYINYVATTMAYSPLRDEAYGCFINPERTGYNMVQWRYEYFQPQRVVCALERPWAGCAFSADGTLYAIERNGDLYKVNLRHGAMTLVGSTGITTQYTADCTIDTATDVMYWCVNTDDENALYAVDITTAAATKVYDLANGEQLSGMFILQPEYVPASGAPAKMSTPSLSFSGVNLTGNVLFYPPTKTVGGETIATGTELTYTVRANGVVVGTGTCSVGTRCTAPVTLTEADSYYFTVTTTNEAGESLPVGSRKFVGPDTPKGPSSVNTQITADGNVRVYWYSISSTGVNGGNVDNSNATYTCVRYPDMKVICENETGRDFTDEPANPSLRTEYWYEVTATTSGMTTAPVKSAVYAMGPYTAPASITFTNNLSPMGWTIINANDDSYKFSYSSSYKCLELYGSQGFDDWAITPAVKVRAGTAYPVSVVLKSSSYRDETFEVKWGTAPTVEAMTNTLIPSTTFKNNASEGQTFTGEITPDATGAIYIGVHGTTPSPSYTIDLLSITIEDGMVATAPQAPGNFSAVSPSDGSRKVDISLTVPTLAVDGTTLEGESAVTRVDILRDNEVIKSFTEGLDGGATLTYTDDAEALTFGTHLYSAIAANANGESPAAEAEVLVGARKPVAPTFALMTEDGNTGKVTVSWEPVVTDVEGNTIAADAVTYQIIDRAYNVVADNVSGSSIQLQAVPEGEGQAFCQYGVYAVTPGGKSDKMAATAYKPVGTPYAAPWSESFANREVSSIFGYNYIQGNEAWQFVSSNDFGVTPSDDDNGYAYFEAYGAPQTALVTGKIDLDGIDNPAFVYYTYNYSSNSMSEYTNTLVVEVDCGNGEGFVNVQANRVDQTGPANQWNKVVVPLDDYRGQTVIFRIVPKNIQLAFFTLDNLRVMNYVEYNLSATQVSAPEVVEVNKPFEIEVTIHNTGENILRNYTVELWEGSNLVESKDGSVIDPDAVKTFTFETQVGVHHGEYVEYHAEVYCDADLNESDNTSPVATVGVLTAAVPHVNDLTASQCDQGAQLTWSHVDLSSAPGEPFTETFDAAASWGSEVEGWKFVDQDKKPVGGIQITAFPCTGLQSWFVADNTLPAIQQIAGSEVAWAAHSGTKFLASQYVMANNQSFRSDDWAITPLLYTGSHMLSFYARSFDADYLESFEVLASSSTTNLDDFVSIGRGIDIPTTWKQYRYKLPDGTKYAAIRSRSYDKFMIFVDDVTFIPADAAPAALTHHGYHIYRDNVRLTDTPVTDATYTDVTAQPGRNYEYFITSMYDKGESRASNRVSLQLSGASLTGTDATLRIAVSGNAIIVTGATGPVEVVAADGRVIALRDAAPALRIPVAAGVYLIRTAALTRKVIVK